MRKPSVAAINRLEIRFDKMTGDNGPARISGLRVRPPCVSQEEFDAATARGEPDFITRGALTVLRPITFEMAEAEKLLEADHSSSTWTRK